MDKLGVLNFDPMNGKWEKPPPGYLKLNTNGSYRDGVVAFGGLLRYNQDSWLWGYIGR